jgi:hypothetical protein
MTTEQRLARLERENRWMRRLGAVAVAVAAAVFLVGQGKDKPRVVEAQKFVLRDSEGKSRAELSLRERGGVGLDLRDGAGTPRASLLLLRPDAPMLALRDGSGRSRLVLSAADEGATDMLIKDARGNARVLLGVSHRGSGGIEVYAPNGTVIWKAPKD